MTSQYIETEINGAVVKFEIDQSEMTGEVPASGAMGKIQQILPDIKAAVQSVSQLILESISAMPSKPSEISAEFGINIKAGAGVLVASSSLGAQIKVSLKWSG